MITAQHCFPKTSYTSIKNNKVILEGCRNKENGLWNIPLQSKNNNSGQRHKYKALANSVIQDVKTKQDLAQYLHACAYSPVKSTFLRAFKRNHFQSWPGHLQKSMATCKGHTRMVQQGLRSTKHQPPADDNDPDLSPTQEEGNIKTNNLFVTMIPTSEFYKSYSDQTGKFPVKSSRGNQ